MITQELVTNHNIACELSKKEVPQGEWMAEPNRIEFHHAGYSCLLSRNFSMLNWCGYVGVGKTHPYYSMDESKSYELDIDIHGGITYGSMCSEVICHFSDNDSEPLFWLGFDCAHCDDLVPGMLRYMNNSKIPLPSIFSEMFGNRHSYKNVDYVIQQTKNLAEQLREIEEKYHFSK